MNKIVYYVAISLDGFIAGPNGDASKFTAKGNGIDKYLSDLKDFKSTIMGRNTYEFAYQYGLQPGQAAYPHMEHYIFSNTIQFENQASNVHIENLDINRIKEIRDAADSDIYLCGGGQFAGWLLENNLIDQLKIKLNPILLGEGIPLFGNTTTDAKLHFIQHESFDEGLQIITYNIEK